jgi:hypothetical protein
VVMPLLIPSNKEAPRTYKNDLFLCVLILQATRQEERVLLSRIVARIKQSKVNLVMMQA